MNPHLFQVVVHMGVMDDLAGDVNLPVGELLMCLIGILDGPVHAVFSLQSLHDLGDGYQVERIYKMARNLLAPGGLFLNADLLHNPADPRPGRLTIERHLELLHAHGYQRVACTLETGGFGCCTGYA